MSIRARLLLLFAALIPNPVQSARLSSLETLHRQRIDHAARVVRIWWNNTT